jgi:hypothetical protein
MEIIRTKPSDQLIGTRDDKLKPSARRNAASSSGKNEGSAGGGEGYFMTTPNKTLLETGP